MRFYQKIPPHHCHSAGFAVCRQCVRDQCHVNYLEPSSVFLHFIPEGVSSHFLEIANFWWAQNVSNLGAFLPSAPNFLFFPCFGFPPGGVINPSNTSFGADIFNTWISCTCLDISRTKIKFKDMGSNFITPRCYSWRVGSLETKSRSQLCYSPVLWPGNSLLPFLWVLILVKWD